MSIISTIHSINEFYSITKPSTGEYIRISQHDKHITYTVCSGKDSKPSETVYALDESNETQWDKLILTAQWQVGALVNPAFNSKPSTSRPDKRCN